MYRTERELFHGVEQIKELQDSHARQLQDEQRAKDNLAHELGELRQRFDALEHAKVEAEQQWHEKERVLQEELHAVEMAAKEEIRALDEELRSVRRWASEECYSAEEVSLMRDRVIALEANVDRLEHDKAIAEQEGKRAVQAMPKTLT